MAQILSVGESTPGDFQLLHKAAFSEYMKEKSEKSKLNQLQYKSLHLQPLKLYIHRKKTPILTPSKGTSCQE